MDTVPRGVSHPYPDNKNCSPSPNTAQRNLFWILLNQTKIRVYLPFSDRFRTKRTSVVFRINRKKVNTIWFRFDLTRFRKYFPRWMHQCRLSEQCQSGLEKSTSAFRKIVASRHQWVPIEGHPLIYLYRSAVIVGGPKLVPPWCWETLVSRTAIRLIGVGLPWWNEGKVRHE